MSTRSCVVLFAPLMVTAALAAEVPSNMPAPAADPANQSQTAQAAPQKGMNLLQAIEAARQRADKGEPAPANPFAAALKAADKAAPAPQQSAKPANTDKPAPPASGG